MAAFLIKTGSFIPQLFKLRSVHQGGGGLPQDHFYTDFYDIAAQTFPETSTFEVTYLLPLLSQGQSEGQTSLEFLGCH